MHTSGIDQHQRDSVVTTYNEAGERVRQERLPNRPAALVRYFAAFPSPHQAVVESTGRWYWLADVLAAQGVTLPLAHAKALKAIAYAKVKTDAIDSDTLAVLCRAGLIPQAHMIRPELRGQRDLLRTRLRLVAKSTSCRNSLHRLLEKFNVPTVAELALIYQLQAACHAEQLVLLATQIKRLERELHPTVLAIPEVQRLLWIPGIGELIACTLYLEIDEMQRFPTAKRFVSYCRLVPGADNSAGRVRHRSGSKDGNRYLKIAFSHAAVRAMTETCLMVLGGTSRIPPNYLLVGALGEKVRAAPVTATTEPTIRMAHDGSSGGVKVARDVAAASREVVDHLAPVIVPRDGGRGIGDGLSLKLVGERCQPRRKGLVVRRPLRHAGGAKSEREKHRRNPSCHRLLPSFEVPPCISILLQNVSKLGRAIVRAA